MTEKEKATVEYPPAPTGQNQSLASKPTTIIPQTSGNFNPESSSGQAMKIPQNVLKLINMSDVEVEHIDWLWYPYIPYGKITVIQGDPGNGKTTMILAIAAAVTKGEPLPESKGLAEPIKVIFQTAEDGLGDTVKPRLLQAGADCSRVIVIDESEKELSLSDTRIEEALINTGAKLFILDPLQAYLGADVDMHRANEVRPVLKRISLLAEKMGCAVVFVGHLNKGTNQSQYRGLGSIDIQAAARSVLTLGRIKGNEYMRAFAHGKHGRLCVKCVNTNAAPLDTETQDCSPAWLTVPIVVTSYIFIHRIYRTRRKHHHILKVHIVVRCTASRPSTNTLTDRVVPLIISRKSRLNSLF